MKYVILYFCSVVFGNNEVSSTENAGAVAVCCALFEGFDAGKERCDKKMHYVEDHYRLLDSLCSIWGGVRGW